MSRSWRCAVWVWWRGGEPWSRRRPRRCDVFAHGMIVGKFYPPHAGHHHLIDTAAGQCERLTVIVAPQRAEWLPLGLRLKWLRERHPGVEFVGVYDDIPIDYEDTDIWDAHCAVFRTA